MNEYGQPGTVDDLKGDQAPSDGAAAHAGSVTRSGLAEAEQDPGTRTCALPAM